MKKKKKKEWLLLVEIRLTAEKNRCFLKCQGEKSEKHYSEKESQNGDDIVYFRSWEEWGRLNGE